VKRPRAGGLRREPEDAFHLGLGLDAVALIEQQPAQGALAVADDLGDGGGSSTVA
jgi:hypothetical protein